MVEQDDPSGCRPVLSDQCGSKWQKAYCKFHQSALKSVNTTKFLIFTCHGRVCGGLGNRMQGLLSVFYLAMLLNRTFLINWGPPGRLINHLEPNQINWSVPLKDIGSFETGREYWGCCVRRRRGYTRLRKENKRTFHEWTINNNFEDYFEERLVAVGTIWHFAEMLVRNPVFKDRARDLGIPKTYSTLYGCAFHYIFQQSTRMKAVLKDARKSLSRQFPLLGLHVRTNDYHFGHGTKGSFRSHNTSSFFVCAVRLSKIIRDNIKPPPTNLKWFLAVDDTAVKSMARAKYPNDIVTLNFSPKHFAYSGNKLGDTVISEVLADLFLLAESAYLIITPKSSLSRLIVSIGLHNEGSTGDGEICVVNKTAFITAISRLTSSTKIVTSKWPFFFFNFCSWRLLCPFWS